MKQCFGCATTVQYTAIFYFVFILPEKDSLHKLLSFATGLTALPPLGLKPTPTITFGHPATLALDDATVQFPVANTCANQLRLPVLANYGSFAANMMAAIEVKFFTSE